MNAPNGISIYSKLTEKSQNVEAMDFYILKYQLLLSFFFSAYSDHLGLCRYVQVYYNVRQMITKFQPMVTSRLLATIFLLPGVHRCGISFSEELFIWTFRTLFGKDHSLT